MQEHEQNKAIQAPAGAVFVWVSDTNNLPHYLPPVKESSVEGSSAPGTPGQRIRLKVEIPDRYETEGEGAKQKYLCHDCGRQSRGDSGSNAYAPQRREEILRAYQQERSSLREASHAPSECRATPSRAG